MHNFGAKLVWLVKVTPWPLNPCVREIIPIVQGAGLAHGQVWTGMKRRKTS